VGEARHGAVEVARPSDHRHELPDAECLAVAVEHTARQVGQHLTPLLVVPENSGNAGHPVAQVAEQRVYGRSPRSGGPMHCVTDAHCSPDAARQVYCKRCKLDRDRATRGHARPSKLTEAEIERIEARLLAEGAEVALMHELPSIEEPPVVETPALPYDPPGWWVLDAACQNKEPDIFHPEDEGDEFAIKRAKRICASCLVAAQCGDYAIRRDEEHGVWGGMDRGERVAEAARRQQLELVAS
jgi:hypothetical protein